LNGIKELSPETASRLFKWKGIWFCLNGLSDLPPETADYLFQWNGDWLSLNGVKHLNAESSIFLTGWRGRAIKRIYLNQPALLTAIVTRSGERSSTTIEESSVPFSSTIFYSLCCSCIPALGSALPDQCQWEK